MASLQDGFEEPGDVQDIRLVVDTIPTLAWSARPDGSADFFNQRWLDYTGLPAEQALDWGWKVAIYPDDVPRILETFREALNTVEPFEVEGRFRRFDGEFRWFLFRGSPLRDRSGKVAKWYGTNTDLEERKRAEDALRKSEERWRSVFENSAIGVALTDLNRRFLATNHVFQAMVGYTEEELRTVNFLDLTHEDYRQANWTLITELVEEKRRQFQIEKKYRRKDGSSIWVSNNVSLVPGTERVARFIMALSEDITQRKRAEEALRRSEGYLAEAQKLTHTGSWAAQVYQMENASWSNFYWSEELYRIFGFDPGPTPPSEVEIGGRLHPEDVLCNRPVVEQAIRDRSDFEVDYRLVLPNGAAKYIHVVGHPIVNASGDVIEIVGTAMDITERKRAEDALRASEASLLYAQRLTRTCSWRHEVLSDNVTVSPEGLLMYGIQPEDDASSADFYFKRMHPKDRPEVEQAYAAALLKKTDFEADFRIVRPDGTIINTRSIGHPILNEHGDVVEFVGASIDVTEHHRAAQALRRSEAYLAEAQRLAKTGSWAYNPAAEKAIYWSHEMLRMFGLDPQRTNPPDGEEFLRLMHPEDRDRFNELYERSRVQKTDWNADYRIVLPDGAIKHLHVVHHPVLNESGDLVENFGTAIDVTEQAQARIELEKAFEEIRRLKDRLHDENLALKEQIDQVFMFEEIVGSSPALQTVLSSIVKVAPTDSTVLITGETGTGKELIARAIHKHSQRSGQAFISVNCGSIPSGLIGSELFGHEKGAFTGALQRRQGRFDLAHSGTIFLDEIGELPAETQIALLRVLQERQFERVGGNRLIPTDARVIAATNRDLKAAIASGVFRSDLFYRLNVFPIHVPPLRNRKEDIPMLVEYFVKRYAEKARKQIRKIEKNTLELCRSYPWPGNIRELQNIIERSVIFCTGDTFWIDPAWLSSQDEPNRGSTLTFTENVQNYEKQLIEAALAESNGKIAGTNGAAGKLGIPRSTLDAKIKQLKIKK